MKGARRSVRDRFEVARGVRREEGAIEGGLISGLDYRATLEIGIHGWRYTTTWLEIHYYMAGGENTAPHCTHG